MKKPPEGRFGRLNHECRNRVKGDNHTKQPSSGDKYNHTTFSGFQVTFHRNCAGLGFIHSDQVVGSGPETLVLGQYADCLFNLVAHDFLGGPVRESLYRSVPSFLEEDRVLAMNDSPLVGNSVSHDFPLFRNMSIPDDDGGNRISHHHRFCRFANQD